MYKPIKKCLRFFAEIISFGVGCLFLVPVFLVIINAFKPLGEIIKNPFSLPENLFLDNIKYVIGNMRYFTVLKNTLIIAVIVVIITVVVSAMTGWMLTRDSSRISSFITVLLLSSMLVPFQSFMISIAKLSSLLHMSDTTWGYIWIQITLYAPMGIFMYEGFSKNVPISLEESARLDGASTLRVFFSIVFPLMKPITSSIAVLYALWIWNDYALASIMLASQSKKTLTVSIYSFFSIHSNRWDYAVAALGFSIIPITVLYIVMQKYIVAGVTAGAVKGCAAERDCETLKHRLR